MPSAGFILNKHGEVNLLSLGGAQKSEIICTPPELHARLALNSHIFAMLFNLRYIFLQS
jgi:hypothetical protein